MEKPLIFVTTGTNPYPFPRMMNWIQTKLDHLNNDCRWIFQYGSTNSNNIQFNALKMPFFSRTETESFYRESKLVISHCGIGSIFNSLKYGTKTILMPRLRQFGEFSDDHQLQIAKEMTANPNVIIVLENGVTELDLCPFLQDAFIQDKKMADLINYNLANHLKDVLFGKI